MPTVTRKSQPRRQERREQIERDLLAATNRLMTDGASYTELSVDRLASEAGISRASFYIYFEDKGHLLRRLADRVFAELTDDAATWWSRAGRHDPADVRGAMTRIVATFRNHQRLLVALNELAGYDPLVGATYRDIMTGIIDQFTAMVQRGQSDGSIRPELSAATTASLLVWMTERACQQNLPHQPPGYDPELAETLAEMAWSALYLEPLPRP